MHMYARHPLLVVILALILVVLPFASIFKKAGYSRWWGLLMLLPFVNYLAILFLAIAKWPIQEKVPPASAT